MTQRFFTTLLAGGLALLPLLATLLVVSFIVGKLSEWFGPQSAFGAWMQRISQGLGLDSAAFAYLLTLALVVCGVWLLGKATQRAAGRRFNSMLTAMVGRIPFINKIYGSADQVVALLARREGDAAAALSNVVLARIGNVSVLGMLSSPERIELNGVPHYIVFLPSTPIPASGQNLLVPCADVSDVDISVEEMTKILISLGSLGPGILNSKPSLLSTMLRSTPGKNQLE